LPGRWAEFIGDNGQGRLVLGTLFFEQLYLLMARHAGQLEPLAMRLKNLQRRASDATCGSQDGDFVGPIHALGSNEVRVTLVAVFEQPALPIDRR
jgi:hypothetical protein